MTESGIPAGEPERRESVDRLSTPADLGGNESVTREHAARVAIVGPGRVGSTLARSLAASGWSIRLVMGSSACSASAEALAEEIGCDVARSAQDVVDASDLVLVCVPDGALAGVVDSLADAISARPHDTGEPRLVGHTAGSVGISILSPLASAGWGVFALHPVVSIADPQSGPEVLRDRYAAVTASEGASRVAFEIATSLSMRPFEVAEEARSTYHLACVVASNFLVTLAAAAERIASGADVRQALRVLLPLMQSTIDNLEKRRPREALTGPIARGDVSTVAAHLRALDFLEPALLSPYIGLAEATLEIAELPGELLAEMESLLSEWKDRSVKSGSVIGSATGAVR